MESDEKDANIDPSPACTSELRDRQIYIHTNKRKKKRKNIVSCSYVLLRNERDDAQASESKDKLCSHAGDGYGWVRCLSRALPLPSCSPKPGGSQTHAALETERPPCTPCPEHPISGPHFSSSHNLIQESSLIQLTFSKSRIPSTVAATVTHI